MRNLEHVAAKLACDDTRAMNLIKRTSRPIPRKPKKDHHVRVMRNVVIRDVAAELACDNQIPTVHEE